ncbi:spindle pole body component ALP4 [Rhodotorula toruloides]|uniref:Spindle pole body component n=1 Tax=Rhodotorula toruloides TaxID=5286 RepID=A0A511KLQ9_RHOTO|nr:spindle pole body component ALP4 [Rhodotorula toruloides]
MPDRARTESRASYRSSRPASAASVASATTARPSSSLAYSHSAPQHPKTPKASAARFGGLAEKQLQQLQSSIRVASKKAGADDAARRTRPSVVREVEEADDAAPEGSFIAETSFTRAPVNSRLPHISPRRVAAQPARKRGSAPEQAAGRRNRPAIDDVEDEDVSDSGSVIEEEEEDEQTKLRKERARRKQLGLDKEPLDGLSAELQEALLTEDLLFVLMGIEGRYIEFDPAYTPEDDYERLQGARFVVDSQLDPRISALVSRFLPLATYYTAATAFIEQYSVLEHGTVNHALCAAIREMLKDYLVLLARIEEQFNSSSSFTLQRFWLLVHPALTALSLVYALTLEIVELSVPSVEDDEDEENSDADSDDMYGGGLGDVLAELKAADAAARPASANRSAPWRFGPSLGGETLSVLANRLIRTSGDPAAYDLYSHLLLRASQPYTQILLGWISTGRLEDRWEEFCVREQKGFSTGTLDADYTDEYWERRYTLRDRTGTSSTSSANAGGNGKSPMHFSSTAADDQPRLRGLAGGAVVPPFLEPWKDKILLAGKYLNVIRECGIEIEVPDEVRLGAGDEQDGMVDMQAEGFFKRIEAAYAYANKTLLKLLFEQEDLLSRLETIKHYFFLHAGDVFTHFLDMAKFDLGRKKRRIPLERLQTHLDLALLRSTSQSGSAKSETFKDDLRVVFEDVTVADWLLKIVKQTGAIVGPDGTPVDVLDSGKKAASEKQAKESGELTGWEVFDLDYSVKFPLSLVLSRKSITYYQMIFRHLLRLKYLERNFQETWTEHLKTPAWRRRSPYPELQAFKGRVFALRARMYDFVKQVFDFAVSEVLEVRWAELRKKLEGCETVDQLLKDHDNFLNTCTNECLLTHQSLLEILHQKLFNTCYVFNSYTTTFTLIVVQSEAEANGDWARVSSAKFKEHWTFLDRFEKHFNHFSTLALQHLRVAAASENSRILPLLSRLSSLAEKR